MKDGFKKRLKMYQTPLQADDEKSKSTTTASTYFQTFAPVLSILEDLFDISESFLFWHLCSFRESGHFVGFEMSYFMSLISYDPEAP